MKPSYNSFLIHNGYVVLGMVENINFPIVKAKKNNDVVIIKILDGNNKNSDIQSNILNEIEVNKHIMQNTDYNDNSLLLIPKTILFDDDNAVFFIVMPEMHGTLFDLPNITLQKYKKQIISKILKATSRLHSLNVIHADINKSNVFWFEINDIIHIVLGDFGLSNFSHTNIIRCGDIIHPKLLTNALKNLKQIDIFQLNHMFDKEHWEFNISTSIDHSIRNLNSNKTTRSGKKY